METKLAVTRWIDNYTKAWLKGDADAAASLFTKDAVYRSHPFRPSDKGRNGVLSYSNRAFVTERDREIRFGSPIVEGSRAAVEYWTTMKQNQKDVTLVGCLMLRFSADGLCEELREYYLLENGRRPPYNEWGK